MNSPEVQAGCFGSFFSRNSRSTRLFRQSKLPVGVEPGTPQSSGEHDNVPTSKNDVEKSKMMVESVTELHNLYWQQFQQNDISYFSPGVDFVYGPQAEWWKEGESLPSYTPNDVSSTRVSDASSMINETLDKANPTLRALSLKIHGNCPLSPNMVVIEPFLKKMIRPSRNHVQRKVGYSSLSFQ